MEKYRKDNEEMDKRQETSEFFIGMKAMSDAYANAITKGNENFIQQLQGPRWT